MNDKDKKVIAREIINYEGAGLCGNLLDDVFPEQTVEWMVNTLHDYTAFIHLGSGDQAVAYQCRAPDSRIVVARISHKLVTRADTPYLLQAEQTFRGPEEVTLEIVPRVIDYRDADFDYLHRPYENAFYMALCLHHEGKYTCDDLNANNVGKHNGKMIIFDPGFFWKSENAAADALAVIKKDFLNIFPNYPIPASSLSDPLHCEVMSRFVFCAAKDVDTLDRLAAQAELNNLATVSFSSDYHPYKNVLLIFDPTQSVLGPAIAEKLILQPKLGSIVHNTVHQHRPRY